MGQQQAIHKFVLGNKELEGKVAEFQYDRGWYSITDILGEERNIIYKIKKCPGSISEMECVHRTEKRSFSSIRREEKRKHKESKSIREYIATFYELYYNRISI